MRTQSAHDIPTNLQKRTFIETSEIKSVSHGFSELGISNDTGRSAADYSGELHRISKLPEFQKLGSLYQFAINYSDETLQNRLRHSHDVSAVAVNVAKRLGLSEASSQLAGAIALAHDIGHPPFSHWGEKAINRRLDPDGLSWSHDSFSLTILADAEKGSAAELSPETIEGIAKRFWRFDPNAPVGRSNHDQNSLPKAILNFDRAIGGGLFLSSFNHLEGQIAAQADMVSFNATDIQDGLRVGRLMPDMLKEHFPSAFATYRTMLNGFIDAYVCSTGKNIPASRIEEVIVSDPQIHGILFDSFADVFRERLTSDLIAQTQKNLRDGIANGSLSQPNDIRNQECLMVNFSAQMAEEMRSFQAFCRKEIYSKKTAPFEPITDAVIGKILDGTIEMSEPYNQQLKDAHSQSDKVIAVAEFLTREVGDRDLIRLAQQFAPEVYDQHFPGYEVVQAVSLSQEEAFERIGATLSARRDTETSIGMPIIHASEIDFREGHCISVVSSTRKYVLPVPDTGETIQVPYDGVKRSGESFSKGEPIFDGSGAPISGKGVVYFNEDDDQWIAAICGQHGKETNVFIINEVSGAQAKLLDAQRGHWRNANSPTVQELKDILQFANDLHITEGLTIAQKDALAEFIETHLQGRFNLDIFVSELPTFLLDNQIVRSPSDNQSNSLRIALTQIAPDKQLTTDSIFQAVNQAYGGLRNIYPSNLEYVEKSLPRIHGYLDGEGSPYGYRERERSETFKAVYIEHPFEFLGWKGNPERAYGGAVLVERNGSIGIVQSFRAITSYEHPDGRKLKLEEIPIQKPNFRGRYQTNHKVERDITTEVTVVGAGVSGISTALHLIKNFPIEKLVSHKLKITFIDSANEPAGSTYNRPDANIVGMANPIGILGIDTADGCVNFFNRDPERWIAKFPPLKEGFDPTARTFNPNIIITHNQYGEFVKEYFAEVLRTLENSDFPVEVAFVQDKVMKTEGNKVILKSGDRINSDALVFCVGNALPRPIENSEGRSETLEGKNGYHRLDDQAWSLGNINESQSTVVLGTANGALFGALWAVGNGYSGRFTLVSSSGTVPEKAGLTRPYDRKYLTPAYITSLTEKHQSITSDTLKRLYLRELVNAKKQGNDWRDVIDSLAPDTNSIWALLSESEQSTFREKYMPAWNNARYRIPDHHWSEVEKLIAAKRLEIVGGLRGITALESGGFEVRVTNDDGSERKIITSKIVNNSGPSKRPEEMPDCIRTLIQEGQARLHHISGLDVDTNFRIKDGEGNVQPGVYAIGPIVSGAHPESITVPAIRDEASILAHTIVEEVVMPREDKYRSILREKERLYLPPENEEVRAFVRNLAEGRPVGDPRNPNSKQIIPTSKIYFSAHGSAGVIYNEARTKKHEDIVARALADKQPVPDYQAPSFVCVGGGMSVGMTYMQRLLLAERVLEPEHTVIITPLSFIGLHEFDVRAHYQHTEKSPLMCQEYYDVASKIINEGLQKRLNILWVDQADSKEPLSSLLQNAKSRDYSSAILGLTMTPEAYYAASELWLHKFGRIPDHYRGFGDLAEFSNNWSGFSKLFDESHLYETYFHTGDIDKDEGDPSRREYTVKRIASARASNGGVSTTLFEPLRYYEFRDRGTYINPNSKNPTEARRDFPYPEREQLGEYLARQVFGASISSSPVTMNHAARGGLADRLRAFQSGDFEAKFLELVRRTSADRARRAKEK